MLARRRAGLRDAGHGRRPADDGERTIDERGSPRSNAAAAKQGTHAHAK